jgi:ribokinase
MSRSFVAASAIALLTLSLVLPAAVGTAETCAASTDRPSIVVVGSLNVDIIVASRPPELHETVVAVEPRARFAMGGKGANQAVAAARLVAGARPVKFVGVFGNDAHAVELEAELRANGVDLSMSERAHDLPSGQGFVMLSPDGAASSVVIPGANTWWPADEAELAERMEAATRGAAVVMLQREIPDRVTLAAARAARARGALVLLDAGGVDDPIPTELLSAVDYVMPNESELARQTNVPADTDEGAFAAAEALAGAGAPRVLATLGARGALLVSKDADTGDFRRTRFPAADVPGGRVVDATAAGDAFRAAVAVFLAEDRDAETAKTRAETEDGVLVSARVARAAAAAGALAASKVGAAPSLPSRAAVAAMLPPGDQEIWGLSAPAPAQAPRRTRAPRRTPTRVPCGSARGSTPCVRVWTLLRESLGQKALLWICWRWSRGWARRRASTSWTSTTLRTCAASSAPTKSRARWKTPGSPPARWRFGSRRSRSVWAARSRTPTPPCAPPPWTSSRRRARGPPRSARRAA